MLTIEQNPLESQAQLGLSANFTKIIEPPKSRKKIAKPLNFSYLDSVDCPRLLREILINRFPKRPYCASDLANGIQPRRLDEAIKNEYIQHNPPGWKSLIVVDVDRRIHDLEWDDCRLPAPTWIAKNPSNGHAHFCWLLENPVWCGGENQKPAKFVAAIAEAFRARLKGDEGFANLITKNPVNSAWQLISHSNFQKYDLTYLSEFVDLKSPVRKKRNRDVITKIGRNCTIFDEVRLWAYKRLKGCQNRLQMDTEVLDKSIEMNANFQNPMSVSEVKSIAKSISKFCWSMDGKGFIEKQSKLGKLSGKARASKANENASKARLMALEGMNNSVIARKLNVSRKAVVVYLTT